MSGVMTLDNPRWPEFEERLAGPDGCNFRQVPAADGGETPAWDCGGGTDKSKAGRILREMGLNEDEVISSLVYFEARGGFCDCEIVFNVGTDGGTA